MTVINALRNEIHPLQNVEIYDNNGTLTDSSTCENLEFNIKGTIFASREVAKIDTIGYLTIINLK